MSSGGFLDLASAQGAGLEPDQAGDPGGVFFEPARLDLSELKDDVFFGEVRPGAKLTTLDLRRSSQGETISRAAVFRGLESARSPARTVSSAGVSRKGTAMARETAPKSNNGEFRADRTAGVNPWQREARGIDRDPHRRRAVLERFRGAAAAGQHARLAREHGAGLFQVDLVSDVESKRKVHRQVESFVTNHRISRQVFQIVGIITEGRQRPTIVSIRIFSAIGRLCERSGLL